MEVISREYKVYKYDELSDKAKESAFQTWCDGQTKWFWMDENIDSMKAFAKHFDITIKDYEIGGQYNHVDFELSGEEGINDMEYIRLWKYLKNHDYENVRVYTREEKLKYLGNVTIFNECPFTGYCMDDTILDEMRDFIKKPWKVTYYDLIDRCFDKWIKSCVADMDYQISEECFAESYAQENQYQDDGSVFN